MGKRNRTAQPIATEVAPLTLEALEEVQVQVTEALEVAETTDEAKQAAFEALQSRKEALLAELAEVEGTLSAQYRNWYLLSSVVPKPVALCREVFVAMAAEAGGVPKRADVLAKCTGKGISPNTAKTQYQVNKGRYERGEFDEQIDDMVMDAEVAKMGEAA